MSASRKVFILFLLIFTVTSLSAQGEKPEVKKSFDKSKLFYGGTLGVNFGSSGYFVSVAPQVGYRFNKWFAAGTGVNFIFSKVDMSGLYEYNYGYAGMNVFGRIYPLRFLFLQVQPELNYFWGKIKYYNTPEQKSDGEIVPTVLGGVGVAIPAGRVAIILMLQYDLVQHVNSPYGSNLFFTVGVNF